MGTLVRNRQHPKSRLHWDKVCAYFKVFPNPFLLVTRRRLSNFDSSTAEAGVPQLKCG